MEGLYRWDVISALLDLPRDVALVGMPVDWAQQAMGSLLSSVPSLQRAVRGMGAKRCAEFVAGRLCAAQSLQQRGVAAEFPLPMRDQLPVWPAGALGSISHCATTAVAMSAPSTVYCALGVDVEAMIDASIAHDIQTSVGCSEEWLCLQRHIPCRIRSLTLLFSAKEALYKALFPLVGRFKDFHAAQLCGCADGSVDLRLTHDWSPQWRVQDEVKVHYAWLGETVVSAVCLAQKADAIPI